VRHTAPLALSAAVLTAGLLGPLLAPADPLASASPAALRLLPPGSRVPALVGSDGALLPLDARGPGSAWRLDGDEIIARLRGGAERRVPLAALARDAAGAPRLTTLRFPLGTDGFGRDLLSRIAAGARVSLAIGLAGILGAALLALAIGLAAGLAGGLVDALLSRAGDAVLSFPRIVLVMVLAAWLAPSAGVLAALLALTGWPALARLVRADARVAARSGLLAAARAAGAGPLRRALVHALPAVLPTLIVAAALRAGSYLLVEASLSFLGFGVPPPHPSWGNIIADGREVLLEAWWVSTLPGLALAAAVLAANYLGDRARAALEPTVRATSPPPR
jgi:peptide/nickel transport system permease protein